MKILQITNKLPLPARDGGSIASFRLAQAMVELNHQVTLLAMNTSKHFIDEDLWKPIAEQERLHVYAVPVNTRVHPGAAIHNLLFSRLPYNAIRFKSQDFRRELETILKNQTYDLIILENLYTFLYLKTIRQWSDAPLVMRAHNIEHEIWERTMSGSSGLKMAYLRILARRIRQFEISILQSYDYLVPITERDLIRFNQLGNTKPGFALPTGIMPAKLSAVSLSDQHVEVAHLGALDWAPNQEGILWFLNQVWPVVKSKQPGATFHLAGRNAPAWFEKKVRQHGIQYHGEVRSAPDFIRHFPIHIVPLWSGSGMRIKIIEAMTYGRVIVTTPIGVEGIAAQHRKHILIEDDAVHFASTLLELMQNNALLQDISRNALTFVQEHFDNTKLVAGFLDFIQNEGNR